MTPQERELAKAQALAKANARARSVMPTGGQNAKSNQPKEQQPAASAEIPEYERNQMAQVEALGGLDKTVAGPVGRGFAFANQFTNATTLGQYDRILGGLDKLLPGATGAHNRSYGDAVNDIRSTRQDMREKHPNSAMAGDVTGAIAGGIGIDDAIRKGTNAAIKALPQGAGVLREGARYGTRVAGLLGEGLTQFGTWTAGAGAGNREAEQGRDVGLAERGGMIKEGLEDPLTAALVLGTGPALSVGYRAGRGVATGRVTPKAMRANAGQIPSKDQIKAMKDDAYKVADEIGVTYSADGFQNMVAGIENKLAKLNLDPVLHPRVYRTVKNIQDRVGKALTLQELDNIRKFVRRDVIASAQPGAGDAEKMLGSVIIDEIDEFIQSGTAAIGGNGNQGAQAITRARELNTIYRKAQVLEDANEAATLRTASTGSGGNYENALRQEMRKIYTNPKKVSGFSKAERETMRKVIEGGPVQNALRLYGKLSPQGNGLMAALGIGTTATNPVLAPIWLGAMASKRLAERGIKNKFDELGEQVRGAAAPNSGPPPNRLPKIRPGVTGGAVGAAGGAAAPAENWQERGRNMAIGAAGGVALGKTTQGYGNALTASAKRSVAQEFPMPNIPRKMNLRSSTIADYADAHAAAQREIGRAGGSPDQRQMHDMAIAIMVEKGLDPVPAIKAIRAKESADAAAFIKKNPGRNTPDGGLIPEPPRKKKPPAN